MSLCDFTGDPGLHLLISRQLLPHPRIPVITGVRLDRGRQQTRGLNNTLHLLLPGKSFLLRPCSSCCLFHPCCSLLPRARAHRDLLNVFFCLVLRRIPCCKASCQYSLYWDCSFCPNITLPSGRPSKGALVSTGAL